MTSANEKSTFRLYNNYTQPQPTNFAENAFLIIKWAEFYNQLMHVRFHPIV